MADTTTPVYSFVLPEIDGSDGTWGTKLNSNLTALDGLLSGSANLQNASFTGTASFGGSTGTAGQVLKSQGAGANAIWTDDSNTTYTAGSGLSLTGTEFANTAPDQTVVLTGAGATSISGTYPNFTITSTNTTYSVGDGGLTEINFTSADNTKLDGIEASADVTDTANVTAAGALMDSELTSEASVKALDQGVATTDSPAFVNLTLSGTGSVKVPSGTTAQRDGSPANGMFRYNSTNEQFEGYQSGAWGAIGGGGGSNTFTADTFTGDGSTTAYALSQVVNSEDNLLVFIAGVFQQQSAYSIATASGATTLTFATAPANTREIIVYSVASAVSGTNLNIDSMTGDGSDTTLSLSINPVNENNTQVFIDGVYQNKDTYSISGTTLTFSTAPPTGSAVEVMTMTQTEINVPVDGTITPAKIASGDFYFDTNTLYVDSTNNRVGIGTSSPNRSLEAHSTQVVVASFKSTSGEARISFSDPNTTDDTKVTIGSSGDALKINTLGSERMRIDSSGNVGIGTSSPISSLDARDTSATSTTAQTNLIARFVANGSNADSHIQISNGVDHSANIGIAGGANLYFANDGNERMRIDSSGNVGIGFSAAPNAALQVSKGISSGAPAPGANTAAACFGNDTSANAYGVVIGADGFGVGYISAQRTDGAAAIYSLALQPNGGNVGIGTGSPSAKLQVTSMANLSEASPHFRIQGAGYQGYHWLDGNAYYIGQNSTVRRMRIYSGSESSGVNLSNGQTSWGTFSDERLKYDVEPVENAVESLSNLRTVKYRLKDVDSAEDKKKLGLMAQDLVGVLDEVIDPVKRTGDDTEYMSVRYTELVPVLVKAIQEQQTLIESLTSRIAALEE